MTKESIENIQIYTPKYLENIRIDGVTLENIPAGQTGKIATRLNISTFDLNFRTIANEILGIFINGNFADSLNTILIHITPNRKAIIYYNFPHSLTVRLNSPKKAGFAIFKHEILDIEGIDFHDSISELKFQKGDQLLYLFRVNWSFGLYFDLSRTREFNEISKDLGKFYRKLAFFDIYEYLEKQSNFTKLLSLGWFPFLSLIHNNIEKLMESVDNPRDYLVNVESLKNTFNKDFLETMLKNWFSNPIFKSKESIIRAAISSYLMHTQEGYINCIKNLATEIEGVIRIIYTTENGKSPSTREMMNFIKDKGLNKFTSDNSLGFPGLFYEYLSEVLFKGFDLTTGDIPGSRHSFAHGVAREDTYTMEKSLQLILTLDQIFFFV
jgi:hypothetical protein